MLIKKVKLKDNSDNLSFITKEKIKLVFDNILFFKCNSSVKLRIGFIFQPFLKITKIVYNCNIFADINFLFLLFNVFILNENIGSRSNGFYCIQERYDKIFFWKILKNKPRIEYDES